VVERNVMANLKYEFRTHALRSPGAGPRNGKGSAGNHKTVSE
jgi:hypothetical protein